MSIISAENLSLSLEGKEVLKDVSFTIKAGEYVGLIGPNGAGKTSLIKVLLGIYKPTKGAVKVPPKSSIGYVPQSSVLSGVNSISVKEVLMMSGISQKSTLEHSLKRVGLSAEYAARNFHQLSGGQAQRVIIARALCTDPKVLIFDEPLNGVDFESKNKIYELLSTLNQNEKLTILFVSHEVDHIIQQCHHILCLNQTMHTGCHPMEFAAGKITDCSLFETLPKVIPVHHHHPQP